MTKLNGTLVTFPVSETIAILASFLQQQST